MGAFIINIAIIIISALQYTSLIIFISRHHCIEPKRLLYCGSQLSLAICGVMLDYSLVKLKFVLKSCWRYELGSRKA